MLNKFMSIFGVGSAKIDLVLDKDEYYIGDTIQGEIQIEGGTVEQFINKIDVEFVIKIKMKDKNFSSTITTIPISNDFILQPEERKVISFKYVLPSNLLLSRKRVSYTFQTNLDIAGGLDSIDFDDIKINPLPTFETIFLAMKSLGFYERPESGMFDGHYQEFKFSPTSLFKSEVREVEFIGDVIGEDVHLLLELEIFNTLGIGEKELNKEIVITKNELDSVETVAKRLQTIMEEMLQQPSLYNNKISHDFGKALKGLNKNKKRVGITNDVGYAVSSSYLDSFKVESDGVDDLDFDFDFDLGDIFDF